MDLNDVFGVMPNRPDHPDMWKLSEILLGMDAGMEPSVPAEEKEALWQKRVTEVGINPEVVSYAATQRAFGSAGVRTRNDLLDPAKAIQVMRLASAWLDGFIAGARFKEQS